MMWCCKSGNCKRRFESERFGMADDKPARWLGDTVRQTIKRDAVSTWAPFGAGSLLALVARKTVVDWSVLVCAGCARCNQRLPRGAGCCEDRLAALDRCLACHRSRNRPMVAD